MLIFLPIYVAWVAISIEIRRDPSFHCHRRHIFVNHDNPPKGLSAGG